ncbi:MAG: radical SAM family heme chaperone HemW [Deltaproteobacteria bacterium]
MSKKLALYVHIPFCKKKCAYCDFNSYGNKGKLVKAYIESVCKEIELSKSENKCIAGSIFIGGGTPTLIDETFIENILGEFKRCYNIAPNCEISIESNPGTLDYSKLKAYINAGINRLSIGLQSSHDKHLKVLGRIHNYQIFKESYWEARKAGFKNINVDLMFGIPGQSIYEWKETLKKVVSLQPEHLSCYSLKIEKGTLFGRVYNEDCNKIHNSYPKLPSEGEEREMYHTAIEYLKQNGYKHYEISNFSKEGFECKHNLTYWKCEDYLGFGAGSHSYYESKRFRNFLRIEKYIKFLTDNSLPRTDFKKINKPEAIKEYTILGLRLLEGIDTIRFKELFDIDFELIFKEQIQRLLKSELIQKTGQSYSLTEKGLDLANQVMVEFV